MALLTLTGVSSCTNTIDDMDVLGLDEQTLFDEDRTLNPNIIIDIDGKNTQESDVVLCIKSKRELRVSKNTLSLDDFFGTDETCFPAYRDSIMQFELYTYTDLKDDTVMYHFRMDYLKSYVDSLLHDENDYRVYELKWKYRGTEVTTIALYDNNDDLVYDNILSNIVIIKIQSKKDRKKILSRSENPYSGSGYDFNTESVKYWIEYNSPYYSGNVVLGEATFYWFEYGHWATAPIYEGSTLVAVCHYYSHDELIHYTDYNIPNPYYASMVSVFRDYSEADKARFGYCIWVGPSGEAPVVTDYFNQFVPGMVINLTGEAVDAFSHSYYGGYLRMIEIAPPSYIDSVNVH